MVLGALALLVLPEDLGVVAEGEVDLLQVLLHVPDHRAEVPAVGVGQHVDPAGLVLVLDDVGLRLDRHLGHVAHPHVAAVGRVDRHILDGVDAVAAGRDAPDVDVVGLAAPVDVADLLAGHHGGRRPADVTRLEAVLLGLGQVDRDLDVGHQRLQLGVQVGDALDVVQGLGDLGGFLAQRLRSYRAVAALGLVLAAAGFFMLSGWNEGSLKPHLFGLPFTVADGELFLTGLGLGIEIAPVSAALLDAVGDAERGAGASFLIVMRLVGMLVGFSLVAGFGLWEFHRVTAHLLPPLPGLNPSFATQFAIYAGKVKGAIFEEYHMIFRSTSIALFIGALLAAATLRPLPRPRWR